MPHIADHAPHLLVLEKSLPARHSAQADAIFDDPFQLPVCVVLNVFCRKIRHRRRHVLGEGHASGMAIHAMTELAVTLEVFGS